MVVTQQNGCYIEPRTFKDLYNKILKAPKISTFHSLRHTNISLLIANGVNITTVSKRLGHSNTATTAQIYAHAIRSADEAVSDTLQNLLKNNW